MGSKAARLARLARAGFPVPEGFCIEPAVFHHAMARLGIQRDRAPVAESMRAVRDVALGPVLEATIANALRRLGGGAVAVRSSALEEDAGDRSFAGQFTSTLGCNGLEEVLDAVREIWTSYFDTRVQLYREADPQRSPGRSGCERQRQGMAVLIQQMVDARSSGILFTANPLSGSPREMTLEAGPGLCEGLAAGNVHPDLWLCKRPLRPTQHDKLRILECTCAPGREEGVLGDDEVVMMARLGLEIEDLLGSPQDIEWSVDTVGSPWLLQSRPITTLRQAMTRHRTTTTLWTQRFSGERWTEQASPLGWSVMQPVLEHFIHWENASSKYLNDAPPTMLYHGVPYFNITIFRHLAFRVPGMAPIQFMVEFFPPEEQEELRRKQFYLPNVGLIGSVFKQVFKERRWRRYRYNFLTNHRKWDRFQPEFIRRIGELDTSFDDPGVGLEQVEAARELVVQYVEIHLLSLLFANLFYQVSGATLRRWVPDRDQYVRAALTASPTENRTIAGHKAMWRLAGLAQQIPAVHDALLQSDHPPSLRELARLQDAGPFVRAMSAFLEEFGHRSSASWEIFATRWSEDPSMVLRLIAGYLKEGIHTDPYMNEERHQDAYDAAVAQLQDHMRQGRWQRALPWKAATARTVLDLTQKYMRLRENQRFYFDQLLFQIKKIYLRTGGLLADQGKLGAAEDVSLLDQEEVRRLVTGDLDGDQARSIVERRREESRRDKQVDHPEFLIGDGAPMPSATDERKLLTGMGISPGRATGKVRILRSLDDLDKLEPGDILVARATDPGWTPLFLTAGGLIMELGSLLSHGAVVAREYALPAVVNVSNATRRLHDGQEVTLDGARGLIYVL